MPRRRHGLGQDGHLDLAPSAPPGRRRLPWADVGGVFRIPPELPGPEVNRDGTPPGLLGPFGSFRSRWAKAVEGGDAELAGQLARLIRPFLLRRRKSDPGIAPELPPKTETDRPVSLTREQAG